MKILDKPNKGTYNTNVITSNLGVIIMKVLSIGNSFSQDAQRYLHCLAKHNGTAMKTVNLYIPGCHLQTHYINMLDDNAAYDFEFNGESTGIKVSIRQALVSDEWDVITLQQASPYSGNYESYTPFIEAVAQYVRKYRPHAKLMIHQTWAYADGSEPLDKWVEYTTAEEMFTAISTAYAKAASAINADGVIPCGEAMITAIRMGLQPAHRDGFHASLGAGRYLLALCWYKTLTGKDISSDSFDDFDELVTDEQRAIVIKAVNSVVKA